MFFGTSLTGFTKAGRKKKNGAGEGGKLFGKRSFVGRCAAMLENTAEKRPVFRGKNTKDEEEKSIILKVKSSQECWQKGGKRKSSGKNE